MGGTSRLVSDGVPGVWGGDSFDTQRNRQKKPLKPNIGAGCSGFIA
ncbi:hypothetical protein LHGZ1_1290 [Laribacter hongkongensis]|uniref:Uncharacterized protein n=1 Tax=Laribacter hongkongensis TaxID=168471 RepID=A0A248LI10_9NEIS|nr:hypothetical protein LHGZ1_1290 [Laribacter hongkongensis]